VGRGPRRLCFVVNPLAGIGGPAGMKGSDGVAVELLRRGARLVAPERARRFAEAAARLLRAAGLTGRLLFLSAGGLMGARYLEETGLPHHVVYEPRRWPTGAEDTRATVRSCLDQGAELIVFVGGDGTARDVAEEARETPILGVPAGVKMYSSVFAETPEAAAEALLDWAAGKAQVCRGELLDVDEEAFRENRLSIRLYGYAATLCGRGMVGVSKQPTPAGGDERENMEAIARYVAESMEPCTLYVLGPGSTVKAIADAIGVEKTLLGVDVVHNAKLVARDVDEETLYRLVREHRQRGGRVRIVVTPIGGQGYILGRGNQQISPRVVREAGGKEALIVVATRGKLARTPVLRVDTGDPGLDRELSGYIRVVTDYGEETVIRVKSHSGME
jgi:predicted polyphosphate/ATP-dependent NAD kinase